MTAKYDAGPAFPFSVPRDFTAAHEGMSLRDWFAGMAIVGTVNHPEASHFEEAAKQAYEMADALIKERYKW